jgi:hypothetical protein
VLDQAGLHGSGALVVPDNITLVPLPPYSPELNPVERVWLYLKERFLSHRLLADYDAIADAACTAWSRLVANTGRITLPCSYPWILEVKKSGGPVLPVKRLGSSNGRRMDGNDHGAQCRGDH